VRRKVVSTGVSPGCGPRRARAWGRGHLWWPLVPEDEARLLFLKRIAGEVRL